MIAVTHSDEVNVVACLLARQYGVPQCIARIHDGDVETSPLVAAGKRIGIDLMINPSRAVAEEIQRLVHMPGTDEAAEFFEGRVQLISVRVYASAPIVQQRIKDIGAQFRGDLPGLVAAIQRRGRTLIPREETIIEAEDHLADHWQGSAAASEFVLVGAVAAPHEKFAHYWRRASRLAGGASVEPRCGQVQHQNS